MRIYINKKIITKKSAFISLGVLIIVFIIIILLGKKYNVNKDCLKFTYRENISKLGNSCQADYYDCILNINGTLKYGKVKVRVYDELNNNIYMSEITEIGTINENVKIKNLYKEEMYYLEVSKSENLDIDFSITVSGKQYGYQRIFDSLVKLLPFRIQK